MVVPHSWFVTGTCWWRARAVPASTPGDAGRGVRRRSAAARPAASLGLVGLGGGSLGGGVRDHAREERDGADGVVVAGDLVVHDVRVAVGVEDRDDRDAELARLV